MLEDQNENTAPAVPETPVNEGGPVPGSSPITVEDAPPVTTPEPSAETQEEVQVVEEPAPPPPAPTGTPTDAKTAQEQALGRAKVEESESRARLRDAAQVDNANTPGGEDARIAASKTVNSEL